ncbi:hypothetical protein Daus18300_005500 [Diaporthe australafricana]|uniref:Uncharacterized protein n=1 Tax=Diaporthe australafricana TaxID=127596 RepID=A0ABR3X1H3_9PEZI
MTTQQVYSEVAKRIILSTGSLEVLTSAKPKSSEGVKNWVPDWSIIPGKHEWQRLELLQAYEASKGMTPRAAMHHPNISTPLLLVSGVWVDGVRDVYQPASAPEDGYSRFQTIVSHWKAWAQDRLDVKIIKTEPDLPNFFYKTPDESVKLEKKWMQSGHADPFWRLLCRNMMYAPGAGSEGSYRRAQPEDEQSFKDFTRVSVLNRRLTSATIKGNRTFHPVRPESSNRTRNQFFYAMQIMTTGRTLFVTEQGRMGVGPKDTAVGDHVTVLAGSTVPFLLRDASTLQW